MTTTHLPALSVRWLIDPALTGTASTMLATDGSQRVDFPFPPEIGHGWFERLPLATGMSLFHSVHRFRPGLGGQFVQLGEFKAEFPAQTLVVQTVQGGAITHRESYPQAELVFRPGYDFFRHADGFHTMPLIDASSDSEMTSLLIADATLVELIGEPLAQQLIARLGLDQPPVVKVLPMPPQVSAPLRVALSPQLLGPLKVLFAQSKALEYLCALSTHVATTQPREPRLARKRDRMHELHYYLAQLDGKLPAMEQLAVQFGMSARRLNEEFAKEYGLPIFAFISARRLNEAQLAILESDVPLKMLAQRLGYSHVNHFNSAFRSKFGYPPGSLRKRRRVDD